MAEGVAARAVGWAGNHLLVAGIAFVALNFRQGPIQTVRGTVLSASVLPSDDPSPLTSTQVRLPDGKVVTADAHFHGLPAPGALVSVRIYRQALTGGRSYELAPPGQRK
jgi:hypothetical protein